MNAVNCDAPASQHVLGQVGVETATCCAIVELFEQDGKAAWAELTVN